MAAGNTIGKLARGRYPSGVLVPASPGDLATAVENTRGVLDEAPEAVFEATFVHDLYTARIDLLERRDDGTWDLIEVKSSASVKPNHIEEVAFQYWVASSAGCPISRVFVEVVNPSYTYESGQPNPADFLHREDVTDKVLKAIGDIRDVAKGLFEMLEKDAEPVIRVSSHCNSPRCQYYERCYEGVPEDDLVHLPELRRTNASTYRDQGINSYFEIPDADLSANQRRFIEAEKSGQPVVSPDLAADLAKWKQPVVAIDFESVALMIPLWPGTQPYKSIPFQWSAHTFSGAAEEVEHAEFLATDGNDPREPFARSLYEVLRNAGTVLYYSSYEISCLKNLVTSGTPMAKECSDILSERGVDLLALVKKMVYLPSFRGSFSMKSVLPGMLGFDPYESGPIQNGDYAAMEFERMLGPATTSDEKERIAAALLEYCRIDTAAMIVVVRGLHALSRGDALVSESLAAGLIQC